MKALFFVLAFFFSVDCLATVRILTFHYNQADFVEIQYKTLEKFLEEDFELIVFNDARTTDNEKAIEDICHKYGIKHVRFEPEWHLTDPLNIYLKERLQDPSIIGIWGWTGSTSLEEIANNPSVRHSHAIQYALDQYGYDHDDIVVICDGDNFLIKPTSIRQLLGSYDFIAFNQACDRNGENRKRLQMSVPKNSEMYWVVFMAFDPRKLPNAHELHLNVDVVSGQPYLSNNTIGDTGAAIFKYLKKYPDLKTCTYWWQDSGIFRSYFSTQMLKENGFSDYLIKFINNIFPGNVQFFVFEHFMHFSAVSAETSYHHQKVHYLHQFIEEILN